LVPPLHPRVALRRLRAALKQWAESRHALAARIQRLEDAIFGAKQ